VPRTQHKKSTEAPLFSKSLLEIGLEVEHAFFLIIFFPNFVFRRVRAMEYFPSFQPKCLYYPRLFRHAHCQATHQFIISLSVIVCSKLRDHLVVLGGPPYIFISALGYYSLSSSMPHDCGYSMYDDCPLGSMLERVECSKECDPGRLRFLLGAPEGGVTLRQRNGQVREGIYRNFEPSGNPNVFWTYERFVKTCEYIFSKNHLFSLSVGCFKHKESRMVAVQQVK